MPEITIIKAAQDHIEPIAAGMREADKMELMAATGRLPACALAYSLDKSDMAFTGCVNGNPACMFGVGTLNMLCRVGSPWLLGTDLIDKNYRHFARHSKRVLAALSQRYDILINAVDDRNEMSKRWLLWLGFSVGEPVILGIERRPFRVFELRCNHV